MTIKLSELRAARAKMPDPKSGTWSMGEAIGWQDGLVATHYAADVLIEVVEALLAYRALSKTRAITSHAHAETMRLRGGTAIVIKGMEQEERRTWKEYEQAADAAVAAKARLDAVLAQLEAE